MKTKWWGVIAVGLSTAVLPAAAQKASGKIGLAYLEKSVGKYPDSKLWASQPLNRRLHTLLKTDYARFVQNMQVVSPLKKAEGILYTTGNKQHDGGINDACLLVDPKKNVINVILNVNKKTKTYKGSGKDSCKIHTLSRIPLQNGLTLPILPSSRASEQPFARHKLNDGLSDRRESLNRRLQKSHANDRLWNNFRL